MRGRILLGKGLVPLLISFLLMILYFTGCAENSSILDNGGNRQLEFSVLTHDWNNSSNSKKDSRATPISGASFDTSKSFNMIADQNDGSGNYSTLIDKESVSYSNNIWKTTKDYYWSGNSSKAINFYAYYPTSISSSISHTAGSAPTLSYTVPDNVTNQPDIIVASKEDVAGNTTTSTSLTFKHIFAAVQFSVGSSSLGSGTISSISIGDVYNSGTYTFGSGWTLGTSTKTFTISQPKTISGTSGEDIYSGTYTLMMIPQTVSNATITVTYSNNGILTKAISGTWKAGERYNYGLSFIREYNYTGNVQSFTAPVSGTYKIECWGAEGGDDPNKGGAIPGKGAYTSGYINLTSGKQLFLYVGGKGNSIYKQINYGGWNGGGANTSYINTYFPSGGGGSTDVRLIKHSGSDGWSGTSSLRSRIMVAAGGGGCFTDGNSTTANGANAGGLKGYVAYNTANSSYIETIYDGTGATQISCGSCPAYVDPNWEYSKYLKDGTINPWGYFGYANQSYVDLFWTGGGGGGWWGGLSVHGRGGGGGSSFISGMPGCVAMSADGIQNASINYMTINGTTYSFISPVMKDGASLMPAPLGGTETGHTGNGYARITFISAN